MSLSKLFGLTPEDFSQWEKRTSEIPFLNYDPSLMGIIVAIQHLPGVTTVWSCEGHSPNAEGVLKQPGYISLVVNKEDTEAFEGLLNDLSIAVSLSEKVNKIPLQSIEFGLLCSIFNSQLYPTWTLRWDTLEAREAFYRTILKFCDSYKPKQELKRAS